MFGRYLREGSCWSAPSFVLAPIASGQRKLTSRLDQEKRAGQPDHRWKRHLQPRGTGSVVTSPAPPRAKVMIMKPSDALRAHRTRLRELVARHAAARPRVFGSVVHGNDTDDSDLDLLVDPTPETTLLTLAALQIEAQRLLGVPVDILTPKSLPTRIRERVLQEALPL